MRLENSLASCVSSTKRIRGSRQAFTSRNLLRARGQCGCDSHGSEAQHSRHRRSRFDRQRSRREVDQRVGVVLQAPLWLRRVMTMEPLKLPTGPNRRFNPLTGDWVLVSPHRTQRPWQGQIERQPLALAKSYDPACYLCPGNARAGGVTNPQYETTFVFDNDFAALMPLAEGGAVQAEGKLIAAEPEAGVCRVICFSPRHNLTLARMAVRDIRLVIDVWAAQTKELTSISDISYVQIFENRGEMMGCSNPHPHCQLWATHTIPNEPQKELDRQREYATTNHGCLLCDYLEMERQQGVRVICENEHFSAVVPFWAVWPYEAIVISKKHSPSLSTLEDDER